MLSRLLWLSLAPVVVFNAEAALPKPSTRSLNPRATFKAQDDVPHAAIAILDDEEHKPLTTGARSALPLGLPTRGGGAPGAGLTSTLMLGALVLATVTSFLRARADGVVGVGAPSTGEAANYAAGLLYSGVALVGNTAVSALRKVLARDPDVGNAEQVGVATGVQGLVTLLYLLATGGIQAPPSQFWLAAVLSSVLNALVKTLETKAFSESDLSLCAPFLAFDPVMQFVVGVAIIPLTCKFLNVGCAELKSSIPLYHFLSVVSIASGAFVLGRAAKGGAPVKNKDGTLREIKYIGPLPVGSWIILFNCVIYGFTFRFDKAAVQAAGTKMYYMYGRLIMAGTTLMGARAAGQMTSTSLNALLKPRSLSLLGAICASDAVYMLSLYKAVSLISPVYVSAIKRGGGVLVSSLIGTLLFNEPARGREIPILTIVAGVVLLCMK